MKEYVKGFKHRCALYTIRKRYWNDSSDGDNRFTIRNLPDIRWLTSNNLIVQVRSMLSKISFQLKVSRKWPTQCLTLRSPALLPNPFPNTVKESMSPIGSGAGRPMSANASLIRWQSNLWMLCPAHTLPEKFHHHQLYTLMYTNPSTNLISTNTHHSEFQKSYQPPPQTSELRPRSHE